MPRQRISLWVRLWSKVVVLPSGCWRWEGGTGQRRSGGLDGRLRKGSRREGHVSPHRQVLIWAAGQPPTLSHEACHRCDFNLCCNPQHLYWGTRQENEDSKYEYEDAL